MRTEKTDQTLRLPFVCKACGEVFALSPSGHQFCANGSCKDGFDITQFAMEQRGYDEKNLH